MFRIGDNFVWESVEAGGFKETKKCIVKKVVLEQIKNGGESVANLFISLKEMGCVMSSLIIFKELVSILVLFNYFVIALSQLSRVHIQLSVATQVLYGILKGNCNVFDSISKKMKI